MSNGVGIHSSAESGHRSSLWDFWIETSGKEGSSHTVTCGRNPVPFNRWKSLESLASALTFMLCPSLQTVSQAPLPTVFPLGQREEVMSFEGGSRREAGAFPPNSRWHV